MPPQNSVQTILVTGASGCIGHYVIQALQSLPNTRVIAWVRNPDQCRFDASKSLTVMQGDLKTLGQESDLLANLNVLVHLATSWSDQDDARDINVTQVQAILSQLSPQNLNRILFFSTASILDSNNQLLPEANALGTAYIQSKYQIASWLLASAWAPKTSLFYPTLVWGGTTSYPSSHLREGLMNKTRWLTWLRFFNVELSCHFMHAADIAQLVRLGTLQYLGPQLVLGQPVLSGKQILDAVCQKFSIMRPKHQFRLTGQTVKRLAPLLGIRLTPWDQYCIQNPYFEYQVSRPEDFGGASIYPELAQALS